MMTTLYVLHWFSALVIALQATDRIFQCPLLERGISPLDRLYRALKGVAWACLAFASFGVLAAPLLASAKLHGILLVLVNQPPNISEVGVYAGFAILILRSWAKEFFELRAAKSMQKNPVKSMQSGEVNA